MVAAIVFVFRFNNVGVTVTVFFVSLADVIYHVRRFGRRLAGAGG